jgi:hypothetical protein
MLLVFYELVAHELNRALLVQLQTQLVNCAHQKKKKLRCVLNATHAKTKKLRQLTHGINGHIRNTIRYEQFQHACNCLNIVCLTGSPMTDTDGYIAGFFPTGVFEPAISNE